ncbi:MAG: response regulator transcription factor [Ectothiorhodospiraceae bacterium]|nr:response regulator transcription factor [Chromatiales bacterium]MCP5155443.1 response regulator transcription factor [Ectothiorhodospiraceae bacterium]
MKRRALVVEDDPTIARLVHMHLRDIGCDAEVEADGRLAVERVRSGEVDLVVLDRMLPGLDGLTVCREIRRLPGYVPVLMLTARSSEAERVEGLETGADDYLTKPFGVAELRARLRAILRRMDALEHGPTREPEPPPPRIERGDLVVDAERRVVTIGSEEVALTAKEFDLLAHFARHPGRVFNRVQLLDQVWGLQHQGYEHTVNSHINRLRAKIERNPAKPEYILTVWGVGYKFRDE